MSTSDVTPQAVLHALQAGARTRADLGARFGVLPSSAFLTEAITALKKSGDVWEDADGRLHPNDLIDPLEG